MDYEGRRKGRKKKKINKESDSERENKDGPTNLGRPVQVILPGREGLPVVGKVLVLLKGLLVDIAVLLEVLRDLVLGTEKLLERGVAVLLKAGGGHTKLADLEVDLILLSEKAGPLGEHVIPLLRLSLELLDLGVPVSLT